MKTVLYCMKCGLPCRQEHRLRPGYCEIDGYPNWQRRNICGKRRHWWDGHTAEEWDDAHGQPNEICGMGDSGMPPDDLACQGPAACACAVVYPVREG